MAIEDWDKVINVDLNSCYYTVHAALPHMVEQQSGKIINMSSFVGEAGNIGQGELRRRQGRPARLHEDGRSGAGPLQHHGERHLPGLIGTEMVEAIPEDVQEKLRRRYPWAASAGPRRSPKRSAISSKTATTSPAAPST
jgi:acetoacetyl-CoA reductase